MILPFDKKSRRSLDKLVWFRGSPAGGGERYATLTGNPVTYTARRAAPLKRLEVAIEPVQSGSGDPSPDNVRPISGLSAVNVWQAGKNLYNRQWISKGGNYINLEGYHTPSTSDEDKKARGIYLIAGQKYRFHVDTGLASNINYGLYAMRTGYTSQITMVGSTQRITIDTVYTPSYTGYYCFWLYSASASTIVLDDLIFQVQAGDGAYVAPEAYNGRSIPITIPTPPGTVYGGTLDVLTGVLTVDRVKVTLTNSVSFNKVGTGSRVYFMLWASNSLFSGIRAKNNSTFISDKFTNVPSSTNAYNGWFTSDGSFQFYLDESITTGDAAKTWLGSNNVEIVYTLKDAQTYQLTAQQVSTLVGGNTIWTDAAGLTVEYRSN